MYIDHIDTDNDGKEIPNSGTRFCLNAEVADRLSTARTITLSGDASGSVSFDGSQDINLVVDIEELDNIKEAIEVLETKKPDLEEVNEQIQNLNNKFEEYLPLTAGPDKKINGPLGLTAEIMYGPDLPLEENSFEGQLFFLEDDGVTIPDGGTAGQVLTKNSDKNGDAIWVDADSGVGKVGEAEGAEVFNCHEDAGYEETYNDMVYTWTVYANSASGKYSHAEGASSLASGRTSHAEGESTVAAGKAAHAEGAGTFATGNVAHAEGGWTEASGYYSHAEGSETFALGWSSHAEGSYTTASGSYSHAEGDGTIASSYAQHVQGKYNVEDTEDNFAHIVGNGNDGSTLSNAHTLDWSGNAWYSGDIYVGSTSGTNRDEGSKKLATEEYVLAMINEILGGIENGSY